MPLSSLPGSSDRRPAAAAARPPELKTFSDASRERKRTDRDQRGNCGSMGAAGHAGSDGNRISVSTRGFPSLDSIRFNSYFRAAAPSISSQGIAHAINAQSIAANHPVVISPQAYSARAQGRGSINLSALSAQGVQLPPHGESPFTWAQRNGITIAWNQSTTADACGGADAKLVILGSELMKLPWQVLWFVVFHEIGHVLAGHSENQPRQGPVRAAREIDADQYAAEAMKATFQNRANLQMVADWLRTLAGDAEHKSGVERADNLIRTVNSGANAPLPFTVPIAA